MTHTHSIKTTKNILGNKLYECSCGARKWSNDRAIVGATLDADGWYVTEQPANRDAEMIETEGYGYDWNKSDTAEPLDSQHPDFQD